MKVQQVAILIFDDVEVLDFAGPFEVFSRTRLVGGSASRRSEEHAPYSVFTVARDRQTVLATGGLAVVPDFGYDDAPPIDVLVIPGGFGTRALLDDQVTLAWVREAAAAAGRVTSVCTGSLLLACAGLLEGRRATTHHAALDQLDGLGAGVDVVRDARWVDDQCVTSAGVAAGIDMAFYVVEQQWGRAVADETAAYIEYRRDRSPMRT